MLKWFLQSRVLACVQEEIALSVLPLALWMRWCQTDRAECPRKQNAPKGTMHPCSVVLGKRKE